MTEDPTPSLVILEEELRWEATSRHVLGEGCELLAVSRFVADSRVYAVGGKVAKIRRLGDTRPTEGQDLAQEAELLDGLGMETRNGENGEFEYLVMPRINGRSLSAVLPELSILQRTAALSRVAGPLMQLHRQGIAHRDLRLDNVLLDSDGSIRIVDLDRAIRTTPAAAFAADWLGIGTGPVAWPFWKLALFTLAPKLGSVARRVRERVRPADRIAGGAPADSVLSKLVDAWELAARSPANAPGHRVAYYAFTYRGVHLVGERPWYLRWDRIRTDVDLRGKRLLELGCNMGLLSTFAMIHGATSAVGVDRDPTIVRSAQMAAEALGVAPHFEQVDIVRDPEWEARLRGADIVAAMSLLHWLPDPDRLLRFLGQHQEVIYEGHDQLEVEINRLRSVGFTSIKPLSESERGRPLLLASKN